MRTAATATATSAAATLLVLLLHQPQGAGAFLTGLISRGAKPATPPQAGPLFSVDLQQRGGGPRLDEFGLPVEEGPSQPSKPFKVRVRPYSGVASQQVCTTATADVPLLRARSTHQDKLYEALDGATELVDTYLLKSGNSEAEQRRLQVRAWALGWWPRTVGDGCVDGWDWSSFGACSVCD